MIIDSHCHAGHGDGLTGPWDTSGDLRPYLRRAARAGIDRTVIFPVFTSDYRRANAEVARIAAADPGRLTAYAMVNPTADAGAIGAIVGEAVSRGACGIKIHRQNGAATREVCTVAAALDLPVLYDVMGQPSQIELLAVEYPRVAFIIPHLGSFADDWAAMRQVIDLLVRHPNVFTDTSGIRRFDLLVEAVRRAGAHKVLFGTDGPWLHPGLELAKVRALGLPPRQEALVLAGNWLRLTQRARANRRGGLDGGRALDAGWEDPDGAAIRPRRARPGPHAFRAKRYAATRRGAPVRPAR
jgi:predicted TIM-barrel fold metal-dependent hydrolase